MKHIISLGAGVQSSTMALMAAHGEITPMPECAIFADTGAEPKSIYKYLDWLESILPFPVHRIQRAEGLKENIIQSINNKSFAGAPFFTQSITGKIGQLRRQCTSEFKIVPIQQKVRELLGIGHGERGGKEIRAVQWIGISTDEVSRMKPSRITYVKHRHPLIDAGMSRNDCLLWMAKHGYPMPSKSSCTFCPYHDDGLWSDMKANDADSWDEAVQIDEMIRNGVKGTKDKLFLHRSGKPLTEVDFRTAEEAGQMTMFDDECEGMCGV